MKSCLHKLVRVCLAVFHWLLSVMEYLNVKQSWQNISRENIRQYFTFFCSCSYLFIFLIGLSSQFYWHIIRLKLTAQLTFLTHPVYEVGVRDLMLISLLWLLESVTDSVPLRAGKTNLGFFKKRFLGFRIFKFLRFLKVFMHEDRRHESTTQKQMVYPNTISY